MHFNVRFLWPHRTSHVLCKHSNGERALSKLKKIDYRLFVDRLLVDRLSFFFVQSLVNLADRLSSLVD